MELSRAVFARSARSWGLACAVLCAVMSGASVVEGDETPAPGPPRFRLTTAYFGDRPITGIRRIALTSEGGGRALAILNPNQCTLDAYGEPNECTQAGFKQFDVTLKPVPVAPDQQGLGALIGDVYDIEGLPPNLPRMRAVISDKPGAFGRLLVRDAEGNIARVITLEPMAGQ